jgi:serine/threonine protein kinase
MEGIARALHSVHLQGVIHRDLKPTNVLFSTDFAAAGGLNSQNRSTSSDWYHNRDPMLTFLPKVTDFGLTKLTQEAWADSPGSGLIVGSPNYQAPEQLLPGSNQIGPETDVYAIGAILYECLSGRPPFEGSEPREVVQMVVNEEPPEISSICRGVDRDITAIATRCLMKDPRHRYPSAADLADDLRRYLEMKPTTARPLKVRELFGLWVKRNGLWPG